MPSSRPGGTPRIALIGCGYWGKNLARNLRDLGSLALICDQEESGRDLAREIAPGIPCTASFEEALASDIDGVVVATPAETHYEIAGRVLDSGRGVFVEKPLALTFEEGDALVRRAKELDQILMVGHVLEYHPGIQRLIDLIHEGELGRISYIYSNRLSLGKIRREENILWSFAPHDIAVILRMVGSLPIQVSAVGGNYVQPNIADVTVTHLLFESGLRSHIFVSWLHPFKEQRLVVVGTEKMASFDDVGKRLVLYDQRVELGEGGPVPVKDEGLEVPFGDGEPLRLECKAFLDALRTGARPLTDGESGLRVLRVLQAAQHSLMTNGGQVSMPIWES